MQRLVETYQSLIPSLFLFAYLRAYFFLLSFRFVCDMMIQLNQNQQLVWYCLFACLFVCFYFCLFLCLLLVLLLLFNFVSDYLNQIIHHWQLDCFCGGRISELAGQGSGLLTVSRFTSLTLLVCQSTVNKRKLHN